MADISIKPGVCPKCGSSELEYGSQELHSEQVAYPFKCEECGSEGKEWYNLQFVESRIE